MSGSRKKAGARGKAGKREKSRIGVRFERNVDGFVLMTTSGDVAGELRFAPGGRFRDAGDGFADHVDGGLSHFMDLILNGKARDRLNSDPSSVVYYMKRLVSGCPNTYPVGSGIIEQLENSALRYLPKGERVRPETPAGTDEGKVYQLNMGPTETDATTPPNENFDKYATDQEGKRRRAYQLGKSVYAKLSDCTNGSFDRRMKALLEGVGLDYDTHKGDFMCGYGDAKGNAEVNALFGWDK